MKLNHLFLIKILGLFIREKIYTLKISMIKYLKDYLKIKLPKKKKIKMMLIIIMIIVK